MAEETFYERFTRIVEASGLSDAEIAATMGVSAAQVSRIKKGIAESIRFADGLRLCAKLGIDPWELAFGRSRGAIVSDDPQVRQIQRDLAAMQKTIAKLERELGGGEDDAGGPPKRPRKR